MPIAFATCIITVGCIVMIGRLVSSGANSLPNYSVSQSNKISETEQISSVSADSGEMMYQTSDDSGEPSVGISDSSVFDTFLSLDSLAGLSTGEKNAVKEAQNYLVVLPFSKQKLIDQLSSDYGSGYSIEDATYAVEYLEDNNMVDWNEQAVKAAKLYLETMPFSRLGLLTQLYSDAGDKFSQEQAEYGVSYIENNGLVDWNEQAAKEAKLYLDTMSYSRKGLLNQLSSEYGSKFTQDQAEYGVSYIESNGLVDWNEQAAKAAKQYMDIMPYSRAELLNQLTSEYGDQFTQEQAEYGVTAAGY